MNITKEIENYILKHIHIDSPEVWEFELTPHVTNLINNLTQTETKDFCNKVLEWDDEFCYLITLSIFDSTNKFLDGTSLYIKIFSKISDIEYLEILVENYIPFIRPPYDGTINKIEDWNIEQIEKLKQNVLRVMTVKSNSWNETLKEVVDFLDQFKYNKAND